MAQTLFIELKREHPEALIDVLAPAWTRPLLERMPEVNEALASDFGHGDVRLKDRKAQGIGLRSRGYDQAILLPNSFKSALVPFWAKIPKRTGWRGEMRYGLLNDIRVLDKQKYPLMIERFIALGLQKGAALPSPLPKPKLVIDLDQQQAAMEKFALDKQRPVLALCPGAEFGPSKQWPAAHYAETAEYFIQQGGQVWIFGSAKDLAVAEEIAEGISDSSKEKCKVLAGQTSLAEAIDLLAAADQVVSNDSGLMHVAAAVGVPVVAVYGSTTWEFTPPLSDKAQVVSLKLECSPCFERDCPLGHMNCMKQLSSQKVIDLIADK